MRGYRRGIIIILLTALGTACAPRQIKPVAVMDPAPLLDAVYTRNETLERGLSGILELAYKDGKQRFNGKVYIVAFPDGRFRLEVPALLGGTLLVMASDRVEIFAYYPGEGKAFRSKVDGRSLNPYLPFPLPVDPTMLPALIMGALPDSDAPSDAEAWLMDSGEKLLRITPSDSGLQFGYLFARGRVDRLREITILGWDLKVLVRTGPDPDYLPGDFDLALSEGVLKGEWDSVSPFGGDEEALGLRIPDHVPVTDLEALP